jgi:hypothetical protein
VLPLILAGPIVRRASQDSILVWLATSQQLAFKAEVYVEANPAAPLTLTRIGNGGTACSVVLGQSLYCQLIELKPAGAARFPESRLLFYDIGMSVGRGPPGQPLLRSSIMPDLAERVCFPGERLPGIVLGRSDKPALRLLYGSCRKVGGTGANPLALAHGDLARLLRVPFRRPTALCLIGDQIYADDTIDAAFTEIVRLAGEVGGALLDNPLGSKAAELSVPGSRGKLVGNKFFSENRTGFTVDSGGGGNHLVSLHEFAASYLLACNPSLWHRAGGVFSQLDKPTPGRESSAERDRRKQQRALAGAYHESAQHLCRLMANVPTYMLFDDHEVTDDWNLSVDWQLRTAFLPLGRDIQRNGKLAYWAFQDLGNRAGSARDALIEPVSRHVLEGGRDGARLLQLDLLLGRRDWSFVSPTNPAIVFLDTRTRRYRSAVDQFKSIGGSKEVVLAAASTTVLASHRQVAELLADLPDPKAKALLLVTPGPVFSPLALDNLRGRVAAALEGTEIVDEFLDVEHWLANPSSLDEVCKALAALGAGQVFVLSGDVHFSYAMNVTLTTAGRTFRVAQLTSSALLNEHPPAKKAALELTGMRVTDGRESQAWWMAPEGGAPLLFSGFLDAGQPYQAARRKYGVPTLEIVAELAPLHAPLPALLGKWTPRRAIETLNTVGVLEFFGDFAQHRFLSNMNGKPLRSEPLDFPLN